MNAALWGLLCVIAWLCIVYVLVKVLGMNRDQPSTPVAWPRDGEDLWPNTQPPTDGVDQLRQGGAL